MNLQPSWTARVVNQLSSVKALTERPGSRRPDISATNDHMHVMYVIPVT